ncbi:PREDICTED: collagen alpha-2(IV) chain-like [Acropora digitifera]|uniref:collagen alpha-2(IV) chain-like n=1 Tax=Acropora digitifera TaxID=70779 RepID=UPI00077AA759|nr:PREDICTED: collagen alpha-2(IV) chain-like [Acropora digitifera]
MAATAITRIAGSYNNEANSTTYAMNALNYNLTRYVTQLSQPGIQPPEITGIPTGLKSPDGLLPAITEITTGIKSPDGELDVLKSAEGLPGIPGKPTGITLNIPSSQELTKASTGASSLPSLPGMTEGIPGSRFLRSVDGGISEAMISGSGVGGVAAMVAGIGAISTTDEHQQEQSLPGSTLVPTGANDQLDCSLPIGVTQGIGVPQQQEMSLPLNLPTSDLLVLPDPQKQADQLIQQIEKDVEAALDNNSVPHIPGATGGFSFPGNGGQIHGVPGIPAGIHHPGITGIPTGITLNIASSQEFAKASTDAASLPSLPGMTEGIPGSRFLRSVDGGISEAMISGSGVGGVAAMVAGIGAISTTDEHQQEQSLPGSTLVPTGANDQLDCSLPIGVTQGIGVPQQQEKRLPLNLPNSDLSVLPDPQKQADQLVQQIEKDVEAALHNVTTFHLFF